MYSLSFCNHAISENYKYLGVYNTFSKAYDTMQEIINKYVADTEQVKSDKGKTLVYFTETCNNDDCAVKGAKLAVHYSATFVNIKYWMASNYSFIIRQK
jgi:hypothetical protein